MKTFQLSLLVVAAVWLPVASLPAHEFWLAAEPYAPAVGAPVTFTLNVGMDFIGEVRPFTAQRIQ